MGSPSPLTNPCLQGFVENLISGNDVPKGGSYQREDPFPRSHQMFFLDCWGL